MPLSLEKCGSLGGDVEMVAVVKALAQRNPEHTFVLVGRNTGERPEDVGLPSNVVNPWTEWRAQVYEIRSHPSVAGALDRAKQSKLLNEIGELVAATYDSLDAIVYWSGQHGTSNGPIPGARDRSMLTKPQDWSVLYAGWMLRAVNSWRDRDPWSREEIWLNADPRNYLKMRDLKWPLRHPVLAQFNCVNNIKHERYGDDTDFEEWSAHDLATLADPADRDRVWLSHVQSVYSRLEINALQPGTPFGDLISYSDVWEGRQSFGVIANETRLTNATRSRREILREWVLPLEPAFIHGSWSDDSLQSLGVSINPAKWHEYFPLVHSVRCTLTMPNSGSGWATTKPWEFFAAGTVMFFHPDYDTQNHILADAPDGLSEWLRPSTVEDLRKRVTHLSTSAGRADWEWLVRAQRAHFDRAIADLRYVREIEQRLFSRVGAR